VNASRLNLTDEHEQPGECAKRSGRVLGAEEMHRQALGLRETVLGKEHLGTLMSQRLHVHLLRLHHLVLQQIDLGAGNFVYVQEGNKLTALLTPGQHV
jgi:hypothetical protein